jgi:flagellar biosynthesis protein FlhG
MKQSKTKQNPKKANQKGKPKIICISSGKGGVGKTTFSVNIACALTKMSKKILLIDGDLGLANVDVVLGINVRHTLRETIEEGRDPIDTLIEIIPNFFVLPASSGVPEMANLAYQEQAFLTNALENIINDFDYILVDSAAGIGDSVLWFNEWAEKNIVIITPDPTSMTDAYALIKVLNNRYNKTDFHLWINNVKSKKESLEVFNNMAAVLQKFLNIDPILLGAMPQDTHVSRGIRAQKPFLLLFPENRASKAIMTTASSILNLDLI